MKMLKQRRVKEKSIKKIEFGATGEKKLLHRAFLDEFLHEIRTVLDEHSNLKFTAFFHSVNIRKNPCFKKIRVLRLPVEERE